MRILLARIETLMIEIFHRSVILNYFFRVRLSGLCLSSGFLEGKVPHPQLPPSWHILRKRSKPEAKYTFV